MYYKIMQHWGRGNISSTATSTKGLPCYDRTVACHLSFSDTSTFQIIQGEFSLPVTADRRLDSVHKKTYRNDLYSRSLGDTPKYDIFCLQFGWVVLSAVLVRCFLDCQLTNYIVFTKDIQLNKNNYGKISTSTLDIQLYVKN